jgi:transketolase N-terminal domain/subunit
MIMFRLETRMRHPGASSSPLMKVRLCRLALETSQPSISTVSNRVTGAISPVRLGTVMGDDEVAEGSVWEATMAASHYKLDNLCAVVDRNRLQISGNTEEVMGHDGLHGRFRSFDWHVIDVEDGNSVMQLHKAFEEAKAVKGKPTV